MTTYGSADVTVEVDNDSDTLVDLSAYVLTIGGVKKEALVEEVTPLGAAWFAHMKTGVFSLPEIALAGVYDDTATVTPFALFGANADLGDTRTLKVTFGGSKSISVETIVKSWDRQISKGDKTKYEVVLVPTGTPTEA